MWVLLLICLMSTVAGVPIKKTEHVSSQAKGGGDSVKVTHNGTNPASAGSALKDTQNGTSPTSGGGVSVNATHNVTDAASVQAALKQNAALQQALKGQAAVLQAALQQQAALLQQQALKNQAAAKQQEDAETLQELENDLYVQEGDMLISEDRNAVDSIWRNGVVPFTISYELADQESNIHAALHMISQLTCIHFVPRTTEYSYVDFVKGSGCASYVGCQGGHQKIYAAQSCSVGNLAHEIIHALGLHHEHTREDRDRYVSVLWDHIKPMKAKNFKVKYGNTLNLPYDLGSIMHYGKFFFSVDGNPTIVTKDVGVEIGQRKHLSQLDIVKLNTLYHCDQPMFWK